MALTLPGIYGQPIAARNHTHHLRSSIGAIGWWTTHQLAYRPTTSPAEFLPRVGTVPLRQVVAGQFASAGALRLLSTDGAALFQAVGIAIPAVVTVVSACRPTEGYVEPWSVVLSNGARVYDTPVHGAQTGVTVIGPDGAAESLAFGESAAIGVTCWRGMTIDTITGRIAISHNGGEISDATSATLAALPQAVSVNLTCGQGRPSQPFAGLIGEVGLLSGDRLSDETALSRVAAYMAEVYGV